MRGKSLDVLLCAARAGIGEPFTTIGLAHGCGVHVAIALAPLNGCAVPGAAVVAWLGLLLPLKGKLRGTAPEHDFLIPSSLNRRVATTKSTFPANVAAPLGAGIASKKVSAAMKALQKQGLSHGEYFNG